MNEQASFCKAGKNWLAVECAIADSVREGLSEEVTLVLRPALWERASPGTIGEGVGPSILKRGDSPCESPTAWKQAWWGWGKKGQCD